MPSVYRAISGENTYTDPLAVSPVGIRGRQGSGKFNFSFWYDAFVGAVTLQRSHDQGVSWIDVTKYYGSVVDNGEEVVGAMYRAGIKSGEFTSGVAKVRLEV